jgi:hypothetical protein
MIVHQSPSLESLAPALVAAQAAVKVASKDATNPQLKSRYADLGNVWDACREALTANGLAISQHPGMDGATVTLDTMIIHTSGQFVTSRCAAPLVEMVTREGKIIPPNAQMVGSAISYLRRYALAAIVGVVSDVLDDDGSAASSHAAPRPAVDHQARSQPVQQAAKRVEQTFSGARTVEVSGIQPACDKCGGAMWDNRPRKAEGKMSPKGPDFACKDKTCEGRIWKFVPSEPSIAAPQIDAPLFNDEEMPF